MKYLLIVIMFPFLYGASQEVYRVPDSIKITLNEDFLLNVIIVENTLNSNVSALKNKHLHQVKDPKIENLKTYDSKDVCISCYENEWYSQQLKLNEISVNNQLKKDSLNQLKKINEKPQVSSGGKQVELTAYDLLFTNMISTPVGVGFKTVPFIGLDYNFSAIKFSNFLQTQMMLNSSGFVVNGNLLQERFTKKYGNSEVITVLYKTEKVSGIIGYSEKSTNPVSLIKSVEIIGGHDLIIDLYISYWDTRFKSSDFKKDSFVERNYFGDLISMSWLPNGQLKILILKGAEFNYENSFGVNRQR